MEFLRRHGIVLLFRKIKGGMKNDNRFG